MKQAAIFLNGAHGIGTDIVQSGENGPSIFPYTSLTARFAITLAKGWTVRAAVLDGVPSNTVRPKRTAIQLSDSDGALLIGEIGAPLPDGKLLFGHWSYPAQFDDFAGTSGGTNDGWYLRGETQLTNEKDAPDQGLAGFIRLGIADGDYNPFDHYIGAGLAYTGPFVGCDEDELGIAISAAFTSDSFRAAFPSESNEIAFEATYRAPITDWLSIQPNFQYIINLSADPTIENALVFGFRLDIGGRIFGSN